MLAVVTGYFKLKHFQINFSTNQTSKIGVLYLNIASKMNYNRFYSEKCISPKIQSLQNCLLKYAHTDCIWVWLILPFTLRVKYVILLEFRSHFQYYLAALSSLSTLVHTNELDDIDNSAEYNSHKSMHIEKQIIVIIHIFERIQIRVGCLHCPCAKFLWWKNRDIFVFTHLCKINSIV